MRASRFWSHRVFAVTVTSVAAVALIAVGVSVASPASRTHRVAVASSSSGPGYPPPGGIYAPFTDCPLKNPILQEIPSVPQPLVSGESLVYCIDGAVATGSVKIGTIVTPVVKPVDVQFAVSTLPNSSLGGDNSAGNAATATGIFPPPEGPNTTILTQPDRIPGTLSNTLGCSTATDPTVQALCKQIPRTPGGNIVTALATEAGNVTNFNLTTWTQRIKFQLINPLLGPNCYIGSNNNPIVINPSLSLATGGKLKLSNDPNPTKHPDTEVLEITRASATDTTFTAPGVTGCGPGGANNIPIDFALDTGTGLPAASGTNSLALTGSFFVAASFPGESETINDANTLLSAFIDSSRGATAARRQVVHTYPAADLRRVRRLIGLH
jgi:hypothetical protein